MNSLSQLGPLLFSLFITTYGIPHARTMLNLHFELCLVGVMKSISLGAFSEDQGEFKKNRHMQVQEQGQGYQRASIHLR